jgi:cation:H+ antiporter
LGIFLTGIYMVGMVIHPKKQILRMGYDSFTVLLVYLLGIAGLLVLL